MTRCPARNGGLCERDCGDFDGRGTRWDDELPVAMELSYWCQDLVHPMSSRERFERGVPDAISAAADEGRPEPTPDRAQLIAICERALETQESTWHNRDSYSATKQLGEAYALLKAGCEIATIQRDDRLRTWWVTIYSKGFDYFEGTVDGMGEKDDDRFYIPFASKVITGQDWY
jgi:hypothetical protein